MEWLKVMWGRKKSGIDMVMVNESRERERERSGKRRGVPEICGWFFDVARRGFDPFYLEGSDKLTQDAFVHSVKVFTSLVLFYAFIINYNRL